MSFLQTVRNTVYSLTSCCFPNPTIKINKRSYKVINLLGEGGYSFVYLVQDEHDHQLYALKKIRCPLGDRALTDAMHEIDMYQKFKGEYIIQLYDTTVVTDPDGTQNVYLFLPYYKRGNLQDNINANNLMLHTCSDDTEPYAHRDLKPSNILISDDGKTPILMDFGSVTKARLFIRSRQDALLQQDIAAENSTIPYRAPELFDVQTNSTLDEKVDIWSLGCTVYAAAYGQNPFEAIVNEMGGSIALTILNGQYSFPVDKQQTDPYSNQFRQLIKSMLMVDPKERPDINEVIAKVESMV